MRLAPVPYQPGGQQHLQDLSIRALDLQRMLINDPLPPQERLRDGLEVLRSHIAQFHRSLPYDVLLSRPRDLQVLLVDVHKDAVQGTQGDGEGALLEQGPVCLLALPKVVLSLLPLCDRPNCDDQALHARYVHHVGTHGLHGRALSVRHHHAELHGVTSALIAFDPLQSELHLPDIFWMDQVEHVLSQHLLVRPPHDAFDRGRAIVYEALRIDDENEIRGLLQEVPEPVLALLQLPFGAVDLR